MLNYCPHPYHAEHPSVPWFPSDKPATLCPTHAALPKTLPRYRFVDGQWVQVQ
jgi:hypothetical protein